MKKEDEKIITNEKQREVIDLTKFNVLEDAKQKEVVKEVLDKLYSGTVKVTDKHIYKCIDLTFNIADDETYLPYSLRVEKRDNKLIFSFNKRRSVSLILFFIAAIIFASIGATFSAITVLSKAELNKDINGDGIADINLDLNDDGICEVNCDLDKDDIPDTNIDYKNNRLAMFNIVDQETGLPKYNLINQDTNNDGKCDLNCDLNNDGWPDINIDYYGEEKATLDIDTDGDNVRDLNIDTDGNGICDLMCDTDNDGKCNTFCLAPEIIIKEPEQKDDSHKQQNDNKIGTDTDPTINTTGDPEVETTSNELILIYNSGQAIVITDVFPDDQPEEGLYEPIPDKVITIENRTGVSAKYSLKWVIETNTFVSENFKYKITGTNGGGSLDYTTAPKADNVFLSNIVIPPKTIQKYTITMKLQGTGENQDYDQGRKFSGHIEAFIE